MASIANELVLNKSNSMTKEVKETHTLVVLKDISYHVLTAYTTEQLSHSLKQAIMNAMEHPDAIGILVSQEWLNNKNENVFHETRLIFGEMFTKEDALTFCQNNIIDSKIKSGVQKQDVNLRFFYVDKIKRFASYREDRNAHPFPKYKDILLSGEWLD